MTPIRRAVRASAAALGLAAASLLAVLPAAGPAAAEDVRVGLILPFSGVYAALGEEIDEGFMLALETEGAAAGVTVEVIREDTEVKPPVGLAKARKLVLQDRVDVLVGVVSSGVLGAMRDLVHGAEVPLIVANAGNDDATGPRCSPYITRVSFSNGQLNRPMGQWLWDAGVRRVYTMAPDYAAGRQMIEAFAEGFTAAGGEIVGGAYTPFRQTQDFGPYLTEAQASGADALYAFFAGGEAISFVRQYASFGLKESLPLYGTGFLTSPLYVEAQGEAAFGVTSSLHYVPTLDTEANRAFVAAFRERTGRVPSEYAVQGYDAGLALIRALETGARDRASIAAALPGVEIASPRGPIAIDPATNNVVQTIHVYETVAGADGAATQKLLGQIDGVADPVNGCAM